MRNAPITAIVTNTSILTTFTFKPLIACRAIGAIPKIEAIINATLKIYILPKPNLAINPITIKIPEISVI